jgi:hypothetical protein
MTKAIEIHSTQIQYRDWKTGQILEDEAGNQYEIVDYEAGEIGHWLDIRRLPNDERVKPEFIAGRFK